MAKTNNVKIYIPTDTLNKEVEQFQIYQLDGVTVRVPVGKIATVPMWVASRAMEINPNVEVIE